MGVHVPTLENLRGMSDYDLLFLRTDLTDQQLNIEIQIAEGVMAERDPEWSGRAKAALSVTRKGISLIKLILSERGAEHQDLGRNVPLGRWIGLQVGVMEAAQKFLEDDTDENYTALNEAVDAAYTFYVRQDIFWPSFIRNTGVV